MYLTVFDDDSAPPEDRWKINRRIYRTRMQPQPR